MSTSVLLPLRTPGVKNESLCWHRWLFWKNSVQLITCLPDWLLFLFGRVGCFIKQYLLLILERIFRISLKWTRGNFFKQNSLYYASHNNYAWHKYIAISGIIIISNTVKRDNYLLRYIYYFTYNNIFMLRII